jgi:hypothetical protein
LHYIAYKKKFQFKVTFATSNSVGGTERRMIRDEEKTGGKGNN